MEHPKFLSVQNVITMNRNQIALYGGTFGIRDMALLESAVAQPWAGFGDQYLHEDLYAMAAAYLFHIIKNHPFLDGNKRTGAMAAYVFLAANGLDLELDEDRFERLCWGVAAGEVEKHAVSEFFRSAPHASDEL